MKAEFRYNQETCRYEPVVVTGKLFFKRVLIFLFASFCIGLAGLIYYNTQYPPWDEIQLEKTNLTLRTEWEVLNEQLAAASSRLAELEDTDDHNYRSILDMGPLPVSIREAGVGGREKTSASIEYPFIRSSMENAEKLRNRLDIERQSLEELNKELAEKEKMWAARPAIQPISNKTLIQLHTAYGYRLHPILGYWRDHNGLDFTAPEGTPIYATGDGVVAFANGATTYGNVIFINHGYDFQTRYAHMTHYIVSEGEHVRRGQVIGYVGNTGLSFGSHCHYEVLIKGVHVNPINFFQRDLSNKEYERLVALGSRAKVSLD